MAQVVCLGLLVADVVGMPIEALPPRGTLASVERMELHAGGCAVNTAIGLARLGVSAALLGKVGADGFGDFLRGELTKNGVDTQGIIVEPAVSTSATMVAVHADGERTFLHHTGANGSYTADDIPWAALEAAHTLHIAGPFLMPEFIGQPCADTLRRAKSLGITTTLDTVWDFSGRWMQTLAPSLPFLDYILPSLNEAKQITERDEPDEMAQVFLDAGVSTVCIKMGEAGVLVSTASGESRMIPALQTRTVDSLGAGDAWSAGFLCGLSHGWSAERAALFGNAVGACSVQALGATTGIRGFNETYVLAFDEPSPLQERSDTE